MADGSVRSLAISVSDSTWWQLVRYVLQPEALVGSTAYTDIMGNDW